MDKDALLNSIEFYKTSGDESVISSILEKYHMPIKNEQAERQQANLKLLEDYPYHYTDNVTLPEVLPVWMDEQEIIYFLPSEKRFNWLQRLNLDRKTMTRNTPIAVPAQFWTEDLTDYEQCTSLTPESRFLDMDIPMYLLYTAEEWAVFLQVADVKPLLAPKRVVFIAGMDNIKEYFQGNGVIFPRHIYGTSHISEYDSAIKEIFQHKASQFERDIQEIQRYYSGKELEIDRGFIEGNPRILFITTHFSTAIQYRTRDCIAASQRLGCKTALVIEKDPLHRTDNFFEARLIADFKPDATFLIDHFRFEYNHAIYPDAMIFIVWIQDLLPQVMNPATPRRLGKRDFILNQWITCQPFFNVGYGRERMLDAPIPADQYIYRPYELSEKEVKQYGSDICMICHAADVEGCANDMIGRFDKNSHFMLKELYREYHRLATKEVFYHDMESFKNFIEKFLRRQYRINIANNIRDMLAEHMHTYYRLAVFRQVLADWLIAAGLKNIKLWGNGWLKYEKYKPYAMGPAQNGEVLSKICQASKIVLGNNAWITGAGRAFESMMSGAFYMSNYIPAEADWTDIRKIIKPGEDFVMFYNRKDLIKKVRYYLKHDEKRREMARRGREVALQKMTYDSLMKRVITFIGNKLSAVQQ